MSYLVESRESIKLDFTFLRFDALNSNHQPHNHKPQTSNQFAKSQPYGKVVWSVGCWWTKVAALAAKIGTIRIRLGPTKSRNIQLNKQLYQIRLNYPSVLCLLASSILKANAVIDSSSSSPLIPSICLKSVTVIDSLLCLSSVIISQENPSFIFNHSSVLCLFVSSNLETNAFLDPSTSNPRLPSSLRSSVTVIDSLF